MSGRPSTMVSTGHPAFPCETGSRYTKVKDEFLVRRNSTGRTFLGAIWTLLLDGAVQTAFGISSTLGLCFFPEMLQGAERRYFRWNCRREPMAEQVDIAEGDLSDASNCKLLNILAALGHQRERT